MEDRLKAHKESYKSVKSEGADRRHAKAVSIGKTKKQATFSQKRTRVVDEDVGFELTPEALTAALDAITRGPNPMRLEALKALRRLIAASAQNEGALDSLVELGVVEHISVLISGAVGTAYAPVSSTAHVSEEELLEALWCCINLGAGSHLAVVRIISTLSPYFVALLHSHNNLLVENAVWALGNCAGESQEARSTLIAQGIAEPLVSLMGTNIRSIAMLACWAVANTLKGSMTPARPFVEAGITKHAVKWLSTADAKSADVAVECAWAISFLTEKEPEVIETLVADGVVQACVSLLLMNQVASIIPCIRVLGNIASVSVPSIDILLSSQPFIEFMANVLAPSHVAEVGTSALEFDDGHTSGAHVEHGALSPAERYPLGIVKEMLWLLSNLFGGTVLHVAYLLTVELPPTIYDGLAVRVEQEFQQHTGFLPLLLHYLSASWQTKKCASWCIVNIIGQKASVDGFGDDVYAFLPLVLSFSDVAAAFVAGLQAPDMEVVRQSLIFVDIVMFNWKRPSHVLHGSPFAAPLSEARTIQHLTLPPEFVTCGPALSGAELVESCDGINALEHVRMTYSEDDVEVDEAHRRLGIWARTLQDTFFGDDVVPEEEEITQSAVNTAGQFVFGGAAPAPATGRQAMMRPAWMDHTST